MTLDELIAELQKIRTALRGDTEVEVRFPSMEYEQTGYIRRDVEKVDGGTRVTLHC